MVSFFCCLAYRCWLHCLKFVESRWTRRRSRYGMVQTHCVFGHSSWKRDKINDPNMPSTLHRLSSIFIWYFYWLTSSLLLWPSYLNHGYLRAVIYMKWELCLETIAWHLNRLYSAHLTPDYGRHSWQPMLLIELWQFETFQTKKKRIGKMIARANTWWE